MTNRERIKDNYEDALFAVWMDELAQRLGAELMAENEGLQSNPEASVPQALQRKNLEIIFRALRRDAHTFTLKSIGRVAVRFLAAALILVALFGCAYAASPTFRTAALNLLMDLDEKVASFQLSQNDIEITDTSSYFPDVFIGWLPENYSTSTPVFDRLKTTIDCSDREGNLIRVRVFIESQTFYNLDIEDADLCENIIIQGHPALLVEKDGLLRISWADESLGTYVFVNSSSVDAETLIMVAESVSISW